MRGDRRGRVLWAIALSVVIATFGAACLHGIADDWRIGHDGFNGAGFSQAARNTLRFGVVGQAREHTGLDEPAPEDFYTNHPPAIHAHLVALHGLFGFDEVVGRIMPAIYSLGILLLLILMACRLADRWTGLAAGALFALTPLSLIFSTMINHEQPAIFWMLACLFAFLRHEATGRPRDLHAALLAMTMTCQLDWPGYSLAFFLAVRALAHRGPAGPTSRRARFRKAAAIGVVAMSNLAAFALLIFVIRGGLGHMADAYAGRIAPNGPYLPILWQRLVDLHGAPAALLVPWSVLALRRARAGRGHPLDLIVTGLVFVQAVHLAAFTGAAFNHSYWTYYLTPAVALAGALVCRDALEWVRRRGRRAMALAAAAVAIAVAFQTSYAVERLRWGVESGHAAYMEGYDPCFAEMAWVKDLARRYPRPTAAFVLDPSVQARRIEIATVLDSPVADDLRRPLDPRTAERVEHRLVLLDLYHLDRVGDGDDDYRSYVRHLAQAHRVEVWDRHLVAVDLSRSEGLAAFRSVEQDRPWWWRWLVSPDRPRVRWEPDPEVDVVRARLARL